MQLQGRTTILSFFGEASSSASERRGDAGFEICPSKVKRWTKRNRHKGKTSPAILKANKTCRTIDKLDIRIARETNLKSSSEPKKVLSKLESILVTIKMEVLYGL